MDGVAGRRIVASGVSLGLALLGITCVERAVTGPQWPGAARLNFAGLAPAPGAAPVPVESLEIALQRSANQSVALDTTLAFRPDTARGDSAVVRLNVELRQSPEDFVVSVRAFGGGLTWYTAAGPVRLSAGISASPARLPVQYVGPGANAVTVVMAPADTTAVGGLAFPLHAVAYDAGGQPISGVPVGYRVSDTSRASVAYPTPYTALLTGKPTVRDSVWVVAETPTHVKDSTRVHIVPPAAALAKISGDGQTTLIDSLLPAPLIVRVLDLLNGGFKGDTVRWTVTMGSATLKAPFSISDDTGYAVMTVTPIVIGPLSVQAAVPGLQGSPVTFTETAVDAVLLLQSGVTVPVGLTTQINVSIPFTATNAVTVTLTTSDPAVLTLPASATIPAGYSNVYFDVTGVSVGTVSVNATATGFRAAAPVGVTVTP